MSALGDYIHLHTSNYLKYGTSHTGELKRSSAASALTAQRAKNLERINQIPQVDSAILTELSTRVMKNFPEGRDAAKEQLDKSMAASQLSDRLRTYLLNNINGNIDKRNTSNIQAEMSQTQPVDLIAAQNTYRKLLDRINYLNKTFEKGELADHATLHTIVNHFNEFIRLLGAALPADGVVQASDLSNTDALTALKRVAQDIAFSRAEAAAVRGQFGETIVSMCGDVVVDKALKEVNGVIRGADVTSFKMNESMIPKSVARQFKQDTGINLYQVHASQDKVDVQIVVNKQPLNVSVKAYTPKGNTIRAHLQDVSLLNTLASSVGDFGNHWLNLHCANIALPGTAALDKELKEQIKYEALVSGNLLKKGSLKADTFVAIDAVSGRVVSLSTKNLLLGGPGGSFGLAPDISSLRIFGNHKANSWEQRISNILQSIHAIKIKVTLNASLK